MPTVERAEILYPELVEKRFDTARTHAAKIVEKYLDPASAHRRRNEIENVLKVLFLIGIRNYKTLFLSDSRVRRFYAIDGEHFFFETVGKLHVRVHTAAHKHFYAVEVVRIVACRDHYAVIERLVANRRHDGGRGQRLRIQQTFHAVGSQNFGYPFGKEARLESVIVPDGYGLVASVLADYIAQSLRNKLHVALGKVVAYDPAKTARSEFYHVVLSPIWVSDTKGVHRAPL